MKKYLLFFAPLFLYADISLKELQNKPEGRVRNYQVWQYMQQDINTSAAKDAYTLTTGYNHKNFKAYVKKTDDKEILEQYRCSNLKRKDLLKEKNANCVDRHLDLLNAINLSDKQRKKLSSSIDDTNKRELIMLMNKKPFVLNVLKSGEKNFLELFNNLGTKNRQKYFNVKLPKERMNALAQHKSFNKAIKYIVMDKNMQRMQESLLLLQASDLSAQSYFYLALNALKFKATSKASSYLEISQKTAYYQMDKDKALFWKYLISKDKKHLEELSKSTDINIYTLYAKEKCKVNVDNYFCTLELKDKPSTLNLQDPYAWEETLNVIRAAKAEELNALLQKYNSKDDEVLNAFIYSKKLNYKTHNYILPYTDATKDLSNDDKALLYSLARQESHFIPSAISHSYALGVMQIMPFLVKALAKERKEVAVLDEMFDPYKNISYAKRHIKYLQKYLYHPLFIAYAYNGGIGFTKRHLLGKNFHEGSFEPYLSMELMLNEESREYGKKVLANYVIYKKILGEEIKITSLFEILTEPSHTDRFRN